MAEGKRRINPESLFGNHIGNIGVVVIHLRLVLSEPGAVYEVVHARLRAIANACRRVAVRRDAQTQPFGVLHGGFERGCRILRRARVGAGRETAACGHYLDVARAELKLLPHRPQHIVRCVRLGAEHVAVPACGRNGSARHDEARARNDAVLDRLLDGECHLVARAQVSHGSNTRRERRAYRADRAHQENLVRLGHDVCVCVLLRAAMHVRVHFDEAGHDAAAVYLNYLHILTRRELQRLLRGNLGNPAVLDHYRPV